MIRARAAFALGSVQDTAVLDALLRALDDTDARVREDAAFALGQTADSTQRTVAMRLLHVAATDGPRALRRSAIEAVGKIGGGDALGPLASLDVDDDLLPELALAIARHGVRGLHSDAALDRITQLLTHPDPATRLLAAYYFGRVPGAEPWAHVARAVRAALDAYAPDDPAAMQLLLGLGRLDDVADTGRLTHWLAAASDWRIRVNAARALAGRVDEAGAAGALVTALADRSPHVAIAAGTSLATAESLPEAARAAVRSRVDDPAGGWQVPATLLPVLAREGDVARISEWMGRQSVSAGRARALNALALADAPGAAERLLEAARDPDPRLAAAAIAALAQRRARAATAPGTDAYYDAFSDALRRPDVAVRVAAVRALADTAFRAAGAARALAAAYDALRLPDDLEAIVEVVRALGAVGGTDAEPA
ncbi:MAG: HEAT repeat domain-containing protein, partial [Longimicrobiales bacterium]